LIRRPSDAQLLSAAALVVPPLALINWRGLAPLLAALALALLLTDRRRERRFARSLLPLAALLAVASAWGLLSALWSTIPGHSLFEAARFAVISAGGIVALSAALALEAEERRRAGRWVLAGLVLGILVVIVELVWDLPLHRWLSGRAPTRTVLDNGAIVLALTQWVGVLFLLERRQRLAAAAVLIAVGATVAQLNSLSAMLALALGIAVFAAARWWPRLVAAALALGFAAASLLLPLLPPTREFLLWLVQAAPWLRSSGIHRLIIWRFTADRISERPLLGWGMDASRALPGGGTEIRTYMGLPKEFLFDLIKGEVLPLHPHSAILQLRVELGILGGVLGIALFGWIAWRIVTAEGLPATSRAAGLAAVAAALPPLLISFGFWQAWWQSSLWLLAALLIAACGSKQAR
jgi:exopolysaccharide production protein ExoQ